MAPKRRHAWLGFALFAVLGILGLFVLDGTAAGVTSLAAILVFIGACIYALRGQDADVAAASQRSGLRGWLGGWF
jgi:predicted membrane channel-forming protein YqfA (hemolysin III family)